MIHLLYRVFHLTQATLRIYYSLVIGKFHPNTWNDFVSATSLRLE